MTSSETSLLGAVYAWLGSICGFLAFVIVWGSAVASAGWVVGISLGWIPAMIAAVLASIIGPASLAIALLGLIVLFFAL